MQKNAKNTTEIRKVDKDLKDYLDIKKDKKNIIKDKAFIDMNTLSKEKKDEIERMQSEILKFRQTAKIYKNRFEREIQLTDESLSSVDFTRSESDALLRS